MSNGPSCALTQADLASLVRPGQSVYLAGGLTPPVPFIEALQREPEAARGLDITTPIAPGIAFPIDFKRLHPSAVVSGLFMQPELREAQQQRRFRLLPMSFGGFLRHLQTRRFDLGVIQVAPPDAQGRCSLGPSVEFTSVALARCARVLALINPRLPSLPYAPGLPLASFAHTCEIDLPLPEYIVDSDEPTRAIAAHIAPMLANGITLQTGLGKVPTALAQALRSHRRLRIHSGMVSDGLMELAEAGALDADAVHCAGVAAGTARLYDWLRDPGCLGGARGLRLVGCDDTHGPAALAALERFVAVNSALEVDLLGQCNLEHIGGRAVSGAGGAPDFARAARVSPGGMSIVALNATYRAGKASRIVACLETSAVSSLARVDVDIVVTEYGVADLRAASVHERAEALIAIAAPDFRAGLERAWAARAALL